MADIAPGLNPYRYSFNNPLRYFDSDGRYEFERQKAISTANSLIGTSYAAMDCSHLVAAAIRSVNGFGDLRNGPGLEGAENGVARIASLSRPVPFENIRQGDVLTFKTNRAHHKGPDGKYDHIAIVQSVVKDENGKIQLVEIIHSSSSGVQLKLYKGDTEKFKLTGSYQWDTPDNIIFQGSLEEVTVIGENKCIINLENYKPIKTGGIISNRTLFEMKKKEAGLD